MDLNFPEPSTLSTDEFQAFTKRIYELTQGVELNGQGFLPKRRRLLYPATM
jgi:hypothetical protein